MSRGTVEAADERGNGDPASGESAESIAKETCDLILRMARDIATFPSAVKNCSTIGERYEELDLDSMFQVQRGDARNDASLRCDLFNRAIAGAPLHLGAIWKLADWRRSKAAT
ncbi:MAG: hypothetical protein JNK85_23410 [Verrucomicrobiales bacterium]|nr:hypothetical protein [Verrucomicrobiales bacterium]